VLITLSAAAVFVFMILSGILKVKDDNPIKKIYFADNISSSHRILIEKFNRLNEGKIEIVPIDLPFEKFSTNERKELLIRSLRSKSDRIDLFSVDQIWVPRFAKWTEPLNRYFTSNQRSQILDQVLETCYSKDTLVAVPLYFDIGLMYCNVRVMRELPDYESIKNELRNSITWERFLKIGSEFKAGGRPFYLFPADNYEGLMCSFAEMLLSQNGNLFVSDTVALNTPAAEKSLQLLVDMIHKYRISPAEILGYRESEAYRDFILKGGMFLRGWPGLNNWYRENIKDEDISKVILKYPLPHFEGGRPASIMGGWNLMISKYSTSKPEALEFIKFLLTDEAQKILYEAGGYLPVKKSVYSDRTFMAKNEELGFYRDLLKTVVHRPFLEKYTRSSDIIAFYLNEAMRKNISPKEALEKAERIINSGDVFIK
jgi:multiple sugar transport system substrate-binding protein